MASSLHMSGDVSVRLLAVEIGPGEDETYCVSFSRKPDAMFRSGRMRFAGGQSWDIAEVVTEVVPEDFIEGATERDSARCTTVVLGSPDEVFRLALGESNGLQPPLAENLTEAAPHWPTSITKRLSRRRLSGAGTVAFDARWFLSQLATSAFDRPLLFPDAVSKLGLAGLQCASDIVRGALVGPAASDSAGDRASDGATTGASDLASDLASDPAAYGNALAKLLLRALSAERSAAQTSKGAPAWDGDGRLIGEYAHGELAQLGTDIGDGCRAAQGTGPLHVVFDAAEPLGLSLGPLVPSHATANGGGDAHDGEDDDQESIGVGVDVGEVEAGGAADRAGVKAGYVLSCLSEPDLIVSTSSRPREPGGTAAEGSLSFEAALFEIDARRAASNALAVTFATAAPVTQLYAVEMPASATLAALALSQELVPGTIDIDIDATLGALCKGALLWREETPRLFIGEAGSLTCAHTDICPQLEFAHGLVGLKMLGIASHDATPRLSAEHADIDDDSFDDDSIDGEATRVPTDRPLTTHQSDLLTDAEVGIALLGPGDLAVFDSGALHFASNAASGNTAAIYQGVMTPPAVVRLRRAAAQPVGSSAAVDGAYQNHLHAADLLRIVEPLLAKFERNNKISASDDDPV